MSSENTLVKLATCYQNETPAEIECIVFPKGESVAHARLGVASCFVFRSDPQAPFLESPSPLIERAPLSGRGNSSNNSRPPLAGRRPLTARAGPGGGRWEVSQEEGSLRSYILGRLHVLPRQPLKWLHPISMVLITSNRKPSIQESSIKQTNPIWREEKRVSTRAREIDWVLYNTVNCRGLHTLLLAVTITAAYFECESVNRVLPRSLNIYSQTREKEFKGLHGWPLQTYTISMVVTQTRAPLQNPHSIEYSFWSLCLRCSVC